MHTVQRLARPLALSLLLATPTVALQGFTTGPVNEPGARIHLDDVPVIPGVDTPWGGNDIQANPVGTGAQNETSFAVNPTDPLNWVGVANDYRTGGVETGWYSTQDGGQTWSSGTFGVAPGFSFSGDPCVTCDLDGNFVIVGMMYLGFGGGAVEAWRSTDKGVTWSEAIEIDFDTTNDKPQVECDLSDGPFQNRIAVAWDRFGGSDDIWFSASGDNGVTWTKSQRINGNQSTTGIGPDVCWGPNSELYVIWADRGTFDIWLDKSTDGGATWSDDVLVSPFSQVPFTLPGNFFRMFDIFAVHADQSDGPFSGNVYVAFHNWAPGFGNNRSDMIVGTSTDGGNTFTFAKVTSDGEGNDQVMPGLCVDPQGNVNVTYYDQRLDPADNLVWTWLSRSSDGGATWTDFQVSDTGWSDAATEFRTFIGDYIDTDCSDRLMFPFWSDGRLGSQDVFTDPLNLALYTDVSTLSASTGGTANFTINIGPNRAGETYVLFLGGSGTSPGTVLPGGIVAPLNQDAFTVFGLAAGSSFLPGYVGVLDATGSASAQLLTGGPFSGSLAGTNLDFVVATFSGATATHATAPTRISLVP